MNKIADKSENKKSTLVPLSSFYFEGEKNPEGMSIVFGGIIGIGDYSDDMICLKSHKGRINVSGKKLTLNIYENRSCEIIGKVEEIVFD